MPLNASQFIGFQRYVAYMSVFAPGAMYGMLGAAAGWVWMKCFNWSKHKLEGWYAHHVTKGALGGLTLGLICALAPPVAFWGEMEAQSLIDRTEPLEHVWPQVGMTGVPTKDFSALAVLGVAILKLVAIGVTILAGYRGGFIFPLMNAGIGIGGSLVARIDRTPRHA